MFRNRIRISILVTVIVCILIIVGLVRFFVLQPYIIPSSSMEPSLVPGDRIIVNRLAYRFWAPNRGDIVVFAYPLDPKRTFVKRIIALEGETVELRDNQVFINGQNLKESYLKAGDYPPYGPETIPTDKVLVLGDNRRQSGDSRDWGLLPKSDLIGKVWFIYYPFTHIKSF
ncbi:MAG TPA: signal peptidase I [Desulfitobacteriaceae bacterium]|jgi:signal peptidase I|nr:signal peptidase I [Desulfitobacteriaceae bacterium]